MAKLIRISKCCECPSVGECALTDNQQLIPEGCPLEDECALLMRVYEFKVFQNPPFGLTVMSIMEENNRATVKLAGEHNG